MKPSPIKKKIPAIMSALIVIISLTYPVTAEEIAATPETNSTSTTMTEIPSQNMEAQDTGVAINNSSIKDSSINSNQNDLTTGNNTNLNVMSSRLISPLNSASAATGGVGGNAVLMLPRNPLPLSNAALGRSNFGLQFGLQNNPILGGLGGKQSGLGWFLQGGFTIPFGKIPQAVKAQNNQLDDMRQLQMERERNVLGQIQPDNGKKDSLDYKTKVKGKVSGMGAYNYGTIPSSKISLSETMGEGLKQIQPKLLALSSAEVYSKPLNIGDKIGIIEVGNEYAYLGHTKSGWIKILLPNGASGWTSTNFEYIKNDFTEIDNLAIAPVQPRREKTANSSLDNKSVKKADEKNIN